MRSALPLFGVLAALVFLVVAVGRYPGGYDPLRQTVSSLFQPTTLDGAPNLARPLACAGVLVFCTSMAFVFAAVARRGPTRFHRKTVQIAGIGAMVYAALVVTPMHDVLVGVALVFFVVALAAVCHGLAVQRRLRMAAVGLVCLALVVGNATIHYGELGTGALPVVQKLSLVAWSAWLLVLARTPEASDGADGGPARG